MKKYLIVIASVMLFVFILESIPESRVPELVWVESCYGVECMDPEPMEDRKWGYSREYCKDKIDIFENDTHIIFKIRIPDCQI